MDLIYSLYNKEEHDGNRTLPCDPTAISSLLQERLTHETQWGMAIFFIICGRKRKKIDCVRFQRYLWKKYPIACKQKGLEWYLFFPKAVEAKLFFDSKASVDHQTGVCRAEDSKAGR